MSWSHAPSIGGKAAASQTRGAGGVVAWYRRVYAMRLSPAGWSRVDWRATLLFAERIRKKRQRRRDATQPLSQPAAATPERIPTVGDYRDRRGCVYRHAADRLVGVSAGGITSSGKKHPCSRFPSLGRAENCGGEERKGPMHRESMKVAADKSEFAAERVGFFGVSGRTRRCCFVRW